MTKYNYEILENGYIKRTSETGLQAWIPNDPANSDYQAYLNPVEHLTEIIPADEA